MFSPLDISNTYMEYCILKWWQETGEFHNLWWSCYNTVSASRKISSAYFLLSLSPSNPFSRAFRQWAHRMVYCSQKVYDAQVVGGHTKLASSQTGCLMLCQNCKHSRAQGRNKKMVTRGREMVSKKELLGCKLVDSEPDPVVEPSAEVTVGTVRSANLKAGYTLTAIMWK